MNIKKNKSKMKNEEYFEVANLPLEFEIRRFR